MKIVKTVRKLKSCVGENLNDLFLSGHTFSIISENCVSLAKLFKQSFGVRSLHTLETAKAAVYLKAVNTALMQVGKMCVFTGKTSF